VADRLILDTGVLIAAERGGADLRALVGDGDPAIAGVTAMELLVGVERAAAEHKDLRALHTEALLAVLPVEPYTIAVARTHALLDVYARRTGRPRGAFDLIIAATAVANGRTLVTTDANAAFDDLPGLSVQVVEQA
jgi:tRNA(fMet)-specific endonuclease VapC